MYNNPVKKLNSEARRKAREAEEKELERLEKTTKQTGLFK
jgi:hypothetical protein